MCSDSIPDPQRLLVEARQGCEACLGTLLELYRNYLQVLARTQMGHQLQAQLSSSDLVQETFLEAYRDFQQFRGQSEAELMSWLRRILLHNLGRVVQRQVQAKKRDVRREVSLERRLASLQRSAVGVEGALVSRVSSPSSQAQRRELAAVLCDQLAQLPPDYREVIILRNLEGLAFDEVAQRMKRSSAAVRILWMRALDRLRRLLKREDLI
jgi:RNA polymerase sigma-70 factor (ECF subfamily)